MKNQGFHLTRGRFALILTAIALLGSFLQNASEERTKQKEEAAQAVVGAEAEEYLDPPGSEGAYDREKAMLQERIGEEAKQKGALREESASGGDPRSGVSRTT